MHVSGRGGLLMLCNGVLQGAACERTKDRVTCLMCIDLEE